MTLLEPVLLSSEAFENPLIGIHMKVGRFFGLFGEKGRIKRQNARLRLLIFIGVILWILKFTVLMAYLSTTLKSFDKGSYTWANTILYCSMSTWLINFFWQRKRIGVLTEFMATELQRIGHGLDMHEDIMLKKASKMYRYSTYAVWFVCFGAGVKVVFETVIRGIISPDFMFDFSENSTVYRPLRLFMPYHVVSHSFFVAQFLPLFCTLFQSQMVGLIYTFAPSMMEFLALKLDVLSHQIENMKLAKVISQDINVDELNNKSKNLWRLELCKFVIKDQMKLRWFAKELEIFMKISVFVDFLSFSIQLCFGFYTMATADDIFPAMSLSSVSLLILWPFHAKASRIAEKCDNLKFAIYCCDWYNYPVALQKLIYTMMYDSQEPIKLKAFFVELDLTTFSKIVNAGVSYFNMVRSMTEA